MVMSDLIKEAVLMGATVPEIKDAAIKSGMDTLRMRALKAIKDGISTIDEAVRCTVPDKK